MINKKDTDKDNVIYNERSIPKKYMPTLLQAQNVVDMFTKCLCK